MHEIITIGIVAVIIGLIYLIRTKSQKSKSSIALQFVLFTLVLWAISNYYSLNSPDSELTLFWMRVVMSVTILLIYGMYLLGNYFPTDRASAPKVLTLFLGGLSILLAILASVSDKIILGVTIEEQITPEFGTFIPIFGLTILSEISIFSVLSFRRYKRVTGREKQQLLYLALGLVITTVLGFITNFIFVVLLESSDLVILGPIFALVFVYFILLAIIKHRLFDIRFLIGRILYYSILVLIPYLAFFAGLSLTISHSDNPFSVDILILAIPLSGLFVWIFRRFDKVLKNQIALRIINPGYSPLEVADTFTNKLSIELDLKGISDSLTDVISKSIRPSYSKVIITNNKSNPEEGKFKSLIDALIKITKLKQTKPIFLDEIDKLKYSSDSTNQPLIEELKKEMDENQTKAIYPLQTRTNLHGFVLLGQKEADTPYTQQDIDFLNSIATTASVAIERSLLYTEVQDFANTLQIKVDEATKELQQANTNLADTLHKLQEVRRREQDMIDVMGHELRTPMSIVRNALSLLEREYESTEGKIETDKLKKYLDMASESAKREVTLIETLLSATKIDASRIQLHLTKTDFKDVINDAIQGQLPLIQEKSLELDFDPPKHDIFTFCDRTRVQQIMDNFLSNAAKYTPKGTIKINIWEDENNGWISIADNGIGVDEQDLQNLGKKFFRAKQYIPRQDGPGEKVIRPGGTGLGLYVTFELIRAMGGHLYINSEVNKGTTFTWSMPIYKNQEDKQIDQTFDTSEKADRSHIYINQQAPTPPHNS